MKAVNSDVVAIPAKHIETFARRMAPKKQSQWIPAIAPIAISAAIMRRGGSSAARRLTRTTAAAPIAASAVRQMTTAGAERLITCPRKAVTANRKTMP